VEVGDGGGYYVDLIHHFQHDGVGRVLTVEGRADQGGSLSMRWLGPRN
jgi:hypothetical protein